MENLTSQRIFGCILLLSALALANVAGAQVSITRTSADDIFWISRQQTDVRAMYVSYRITNTSGAALDDVWVTLDDFSGGVVGLATDGTTSLEDGIVRLGAMVAGESRTAFFYLSASGVTSTAQSHRVYVYDGDPDLAGTLLNTGGTLFSYAGAGRENPVEDALATGTNKLQPTTLVIGPNPPLVGGELTIEFRGTTGQIGSQLLMMFSPASYLTWRADALELIRTEVTLSNGNSGTFVDQLAITVPNSSTTDYLARYTFRAVRATEEAVPITPINFSASGSVIKHTDTADLAAVFPILPSSNELLLSKSVSDVSLPGGGTVTYTVTVRNDSGIDLTLDDFTDTLPTSPAAVSYVPSSSSFDGAAIADPVASGGDLVWSDTFPVPAGGSASLSYQVVIPAVAGTYTNRAVAHAGSEQIDTTLDTRDDAPAAVSVFVGAAAPLADVRVTKAVDAATLPPGGGTLEYTLTVANDGPDAAADVVVSDALPAELLTPEVSLDGGSSWSAWSGSVTLGALAAGATQELLLRASVDPAFSGTIENRATVTASTNDPDPSDNTSNTVYTTVALVLSITKVADTPTLVNTPSGAQARYTLTIRNDVGAPDAAGAFSADILPDGFTYAATESITLSGGATRGVDVDPAVGATSPSWGNFSVPAGGSVVITFVADVDGSVGAGVYDNSASVSSSTPGVVTQDFDGTASTADDITVSYAAASSDLAITLIDTPDPVAPGGTLRYVVDVRNNGPDAADGVVVSSALPAELQNPLVSLDGGSSWSPWTGSVTLGALADGGQSQLLIEATVETTYLGDIVTTATVASDSDDPVASNDSASTTTTVTTPPAGYAVSGTVYHDLTPNGIPDGSDGSTGLTLWIKRVDESDGDCGTVDGGAAEEAAAVSTVDGSYAFADVPDGTWCLLLDDNATLADVTPFDANAAGWLLIEPPTGVRSSTVAGAAVKDQDFGLFAGSIVTGSVFRDDGMVAAGGSPAYSSAADANDGARSAAEAGIAGVTVTAADGSSSRTATTSGDGGYTLYLPSSWGSLVTLSHPLRPASGVDDGVSPTLAASWDGADVAAVAFTPTVGGAASYDFGVVRASRLRPDRNGQARSPGAASYTHLYTPGTLGDVTLAVAGGRWSYQAFLDTDCNGILEADEQSDVLASGFAVDASWPRTADGALASCGLELRVLVPGGEPDGRLDLALLTAELAWTNNAAVRDGRTVTDTTTVMSGGLEVSKRVRNVSSGGAFGTVGEGAPGELIEYCVTYANLGIETAQEAEFLDPVPHFSDLVADAYAVGGEIRWTRDGVAALLSIATDGDAGEIVAGVVSVALGDVAAGASGEVCYQVQVR